MCTSLKTAVATGIKGLHLRGLCVNPKGGCQPLARWAKEGPRRLTASLQPQRFARCPASLPSCYLCLHTQDSILALRPCWEDRGLPQSLSLSLSVLLQGPSTSSRNTAATVTWWTTCTGTNTPSCSDTPTSIVRPVQSSTATPCQWGSPYPGMREAAPSECLPSIGALLVQEPKMWVWTLEQSLVRANTLTRQ